MLVRYMGYMERYLNPWHLVIGPIVMMVAGSSFAVDSFPMVHRSISHQGPNVMTGGTYISRTRIMKLARMAINIAAQIRRGPHS